MTDVGRNDANLNLRSIDQLIGSRFVVPSYQRGFRWTKRQVVELLDDINEFRQRSQEQPLDVFYCLQPLVVRPDGDAWEVIDGQQRLTTIALILRSQREALAFMGGGSYKLEYRTRPHSAEFLASLGTDQGPGPDRADANIDFYHMSRAYDAIVDWFATKHPTERLKFLNCLLAPQERNVRVIWYELPASANPIEAFVRLNIGKIPLTNAELIRALFLRDHGQEARDADPSRAQIAYEWDGIERRLQDEAFWGFVHKDTISPYPARIEYLFAIHVAELKLPLPPHDAYGTFIAYQQHFDQRPSVGDHWTEIRHLALRLEEWFRDRVLFHLVGLWIVIAIKPSTDIVVELMRARCTMRRREFEAHLKELIFDALFRKTLTALSADEVRGVIQDAFEALTYATPSHHRPLRHILLVFNVATLLRNTASNLRFPFDRYKGEAWDLEHIRSVASAKPAQPARMKNWLQTILSYWEAPTTAEEKVLQHEARECLDAATLDVSVFAHLYTAIQHRYGEDKPHETDDSLANLTLLDAATNRGYKNAIFPVKRHRVIELDKTGTFVPLCTTNVFLKYYSRPLGGMLTWTAGDAYDYREAMIETLTTFFAKEGT